MTTYSERIFVESAPHLVNQEITLRGWVSRIRVLGKTVLSS